MSDGNRRDAHRRWLTTGIVIMGFAVGGLLIYTLAQYQANYMNAQQSRAHKREESSGAYCYKIASFGPVCVSDDNSAKAEAERADDDLQAQQDMAEWAKWITLFTALQVGVGILGTLLLVDNLRQARVQAHAAQRASAKATVANAIAREAVLNDQRPWLAIDLEVSGKGVVLEDGLIAPLKLTATNTGRTPATNVVVESIYRPMAGKLSVPDWQAELMGKLNDTRDIFQSIVTTEKPLDMVHQRHIPMDAITHVTVPNDTDRYMVMILCGVGYSSLVDQKRRYSIRTVVYTLEVRPEERDPFKEWPIASIGRFTGGDLMT